MANDITQQITELALVNQQLQRGRDLLLEHDGGDPDWYARADAQFERLVSDYLTGIRHLMVHEARAALETERDTLVGRLERGWLMEPSARASEAQIAEQLARVLAQYQVVCDALRPFEQVQRQWESKIPTFRMLRSARVQGDQRRAEWDAADQAAEAEADAPTRVDQLVVTWSDRLRSATSLDHLEVVGGSIAKLTLSDEQTSKLRLVYRQRLGELKVAALMRDLGLESDDVILTRLRARQVARYGDVSQKRLERYLTEIRAELAPQIPQPEKEEVEAVA